MKKELYYMTTKDGIKESYGIKKYFIYNDKKYTIFFERRDNTWNSTEASSGLLVNFGDATLKEAIASVETRLEAMTKLLTNDIRVKNYVEAINNYIVEKYKGE